MNIQRATTGLATPKQQQTSPHIINFFLKKGNHERNHFLKKKKLKCAKEYNGKCISKQHFNPWRNVSSITSGARVPAYICIQVSCFLQRLSSERPEGP